MFGPIIRWFLVLAFFAGVGNASAHSGFENETDVRIFADRTELNLRATLNFAWRILGSKAPADAGEAGQKTAVPILTELAPEWFEVTSAGKPMELKSVKCMFEVDQHLFVRLVYERPPAWPLVVKARFFDFFDPMTYGTVRIFDQTNDPYSHEIDPLSQGMIQRGKPAFTYDPSPPAVQPAAPPAAIRESKPPGYRGFVVAALLFVVILVLRRRFFTRKES